MLRRHVLAFTAAGWVLSLGLNGRETRAQGANLAHAAADFIRSLARQAIDSLTGPNISDARRKEQFRALLNAAFDVPLLGQFALGRYWRVATDSERAEFMLLFEESLVVNYADRFKDYAGEKLRIVQARPLQNDEVLVNSELPRAGAAATRVGWRVRRYDNTFKVIDVIVEGVSMAITTRDDYGALIQRAGGRVVALLSSLREKNLPPPPPARSPPAMPSER